MTEGKQLEPSASKSMVFNGVDTADVPSAAWGWSKEYPKAGKALGIIIALILLAMLIGNHQGKVEDLYLIGFAATIVFIIGYDSYRSRRPR